MSKVYKRKDSKLWWAEIKRPDGGRIRQSSGTESKTDAEAWARQFEADLWRESRLGVKPDRTWREAVVRWLSERSDKKTIGDDKAKLRWLDRFFGDKKLSQITRVFVMEIARIKASEASQATANRYTALISAIMHRATRDWEWIDNSPSFHKFRESDRRIRFLAPEEARALFDELPEHQQDAMIFALATGLRQRNVIQLAWSQVDLNRKMAWIHPDQSKNRSAIAVPLNDSAMAVLIRNKGRHPEMVFTFKGRPIGQINTRAWREALKRAGIENFRWHDLRHTFASYLAMSGASMMEIQELGGWKNSEMVRRYAHLNADHLLGVSSKLDTFLTRFDLKKAVS